MLPFAPAVAVIVYWFTAKVAVTVMSLISVTAQVPVPPHPPPLQPVKLLLASGAAVRVTIVP